MNCPPMRRAVLCDNAMGEKSALLQKKDCLTHGGDLNCRLSGFAFGEAHTIGLYQGFFWPASLPDLHEHVENFLR